jgi:hypothetical protein
MPSRGYAVPARFAERASAFQPSGDRSRSYGRCCRRDAGAPPARCLKIGHIFRRAGRCALDAKTWSAAILAAVRRRPGGAQGPLFSFRRRARATPSMALVSTARGQDGRAPRRADHGADGTTALAPGVPREAECYRCRAIAVSMHETARTNDNHGSTRAAAIAPQPEHGLLGRARRGDRPTHLPLDETVTDEHQRAAHGARGCSAAGAAPWPRLGARGHLRAPGLDSQRACDEPVGASWMFDC